MCLAFAGSTTTKLIARSFAAAALPGTSTQFAATFPPMRHGSAPGSASSRACAPASRSLTPMRPSFHSSTKMCSPTKNASQPNRRRNEMSFRPAVLASTSSIRYGKLAAILRL